MSAAKRANEPKCSAACFEVLLTTGTLRRRPMMPRWMSSPGVHSPEKSGPLKELGAVIKHSTVLMWPG
jgi:hypothetical protein